MPDPPARWPITTRRPWPPPARHRRPPPREETLVSGSTNVRRVRDRPLLDLSPPRSATQRKAMPGLPRSNLESSRNPPQDRLDCRTGGAGPASTPPPGCTLRQGPAPGGRRQARATHQSGLRETQPGSPALGAHPQEGLPKVYEREKARNRAEIMLRRLSADLQRFLSRTAPLVPGSFPARAVLKIVVSPVRFRPSPYPACAARQTAGVGLAMRTAHSSSGKSSPCASQRRSMLS